MWKKCVKGLCVAVGGLATAASLALGSTPSVLSDIALSSSRQEVLQRFPWETARTYRRDGNKEWISFDVGGETKGIVTFYFEHDRLRSYKINDRTEVIREYLGEFCSRGIREDLPKMYQAIVEVLRRLPQEVFREVTDRQRPVLFTEYYYTNTGRFANSSEVIVVDGDVPAFQKGLTITKLSAELETADSVKPIIGVVAHELAHRFLKHTRQRKGDSCDQERKANHTIIRWGFGEEFRLASERFGVPRNHRSVCPP